MPVIPSLVLTNQLPINTYTASVVTSASMVTGIAGNLLADGLGNQITLLDVTASYAFTASIQTSWEESSSFASRSMWSTTSSWASESLSSSFSTTTSYANILANYPIDITQSLQVINSASNYTILQHPTSSIMSAYFDYACISSSNARAGRIVSIWDGSNIVYSDTSTYDIGDTSGFYVWSVLNTSYVQLICSSSNSNSWSISARGTYL